MKYKNQGTIFAYITIVLWATVAPIVKLLINDMSPVQVLLGVTFFASITLFIKTIITKKIKILKQYKVRDFLMLIIIGILGVFLYDFLFYNAINKMRTQEAYIINYLWPVLTSIFAIIILKEKISLFKIIALVLSFFGVIVIITKGTIFTLKFDSISGVLMALGASMSYALYSVLLKKKDYERTTALFICYVTGVISCLIYLKFEVPLLSLKELIGLIWLGVLSYGIADNLWALALKYEDTSKIANIAYIGPFISLLLMYLMLGEKIEIYSVIGLIFIIIGVIIQNNRDKQELSIIKKEGNL